MAIVRLCFIEGAELLLSIADFAGSNSRAKSANHVVAGGGDASERRRIRMTVRNNLRIALKCPRCGREGVARLSHADALAYLEGDTEASIAHVPQGFMIVLRENWHAEIDVVCAADDVSAIVRPLRPAALGSETPGSLRRG